MDLTKSFNVLKLGDSSLKGWVGRGRLIIPALPCRSLGRILRDDIPEKVYFTPIVVAIRARHTFICS